jgi:putative colanic acid biosynthesis glycosyltransferase
MKVLQINVTYHFGSTGRIVEVLHQNLTEQGHESHVLYGRHFNQDMKNIAQVGGRFSLWMHGLKTRLFDRHGFGSKLSTKKALKKINLKSFDIIHLHNLHGYYLNIDVLFKEIKKFKLPVIWTLHDAWSYTGHCFGYQTVSCQKWQTSCNHCPQKSYYPKSAFLDASKKNFKDKKALYESYPNMMLVSPSSYYFNELKHSFLNKHPKKIIPNGIRLDEFTPGKIKKNDKFKILAVASIWEKRKGLDDLIKLSNLLDSNKFEIIVIGKIPKTYQVPNSIIHINRTENKDTLIKYYQESDLFMNLSTEDNLPTTTIEALACGLPVVTYNTGGAMDLVDASCGIVLSSHDLDDVIKAIEEVSTKGKAYYQASSIQKSKKFDEKLMIKSYISLYQEVIS